MKKSLRKTLSLLLCMCLFASVATVSAFPASANYGDEVRSPYVTDVVPSDAETNRYYFYMPQDWRNEYNDAYDGKSLDSCKAGIYWWEGSYNCEKSGTGIGWPGYVIPDTDPGNPDVFVVDVPKDVEYVIFNNTVDSGYDMMEPVYKNAIITCNIPTKGYEPDDDGYGFYPDGIKNFDNMIFVRDPMPSNIDDFTGRDTYSGAWFYYYGGGEYGVNKERVEGEVYRDGEFPPYGLHVDEAVEVEVGAEKIINCDNSEATAEVEDPSIAEVVKNEETGTFTVKGIAPGTTKAIFTFIKKKFDENGYSTFFVSTAECTVKVTEPTARTTVTVKNTPITLYVKGTAKINADVKDGK
ncbi:MAG: hypothetical protein J1E96_06195, partial [Ruminococcus sp.]|nr:hypothetical protein [Ruminococcus sp.]